MHKNNLELDATFTSMFLIKYTFFLLVKCVMSTPAYFAEKVYKSMKV